jgi:hypothetical protein
VSSRSHRAIRPAESAEAIKNGLYDWANRMIGASVVRVAKGAPESALQV